MRKVHALHGRDHLPNGMDPIPGVSQFVSSSAHRVYGDEWRVITSLNDYNGGNTGNYDGAWTASSDLTVPHGGYIETTTDGDWIAFGMHLGPRYSSWAVAVWYYEASDAGKFQIEWATSSVDEAGNTTGPVGSATSIVSPLSTHFNGAPEFNWYHTNNTGDTAHTYIVDAYTSGSVGWKLQIERSPFYIDGTDGTPLSANASGYGDFEWNKAFNGGGGHDVVWWCRLRVNGKHASSSGYRAKIAGVRVYRFNGSSQAIN